VWVTVQSGPGKGRVFEADEGRFVIGRSVACDLVLDDAKVSAEHAALQVEPGAETVLEDLSSTNGTFLDGRRVAGSVTVDGQREVRVGDTVLLLCQEQPGPAAPPGVVTVVGRATWGAPASRLPEAGPSTLLRLLKRSEKRTVLVAAGSLALVLVLVAIVAVAVLGGRDDKNAALTTSDIVAAISPSTVLVLTQQAGRTTSSGTGWVFDAPRGLIVTNHHVVSDGDSFKIGVAGTEERPARLLASGPCDDLAVLKVDDVSKLKTMPLGSQADLRLGESVVAIGFPVNASARDQLTATSGVVSVVSTVVEGDDSYPDLVDVVQTDAAINPGNSGGPLVSSTGALIGVNTLTLPAVSGQAIQNSNYAIGVDRVKQVVVALAAGRSRGWTGMDLTVAADRQIGGRPPGLIAGHVLPDSPAARAGVQAPALVQAIDGRPVGTIPEYCRLYGGRGTGDSAAFTLLRAGSTRATVVQVPFA
jgi:S1-C subfamily serine protease